MLLDPLAAVSVGMPSMNISELLSRVGSSADTHAISFVRWGDCKPVASSTALSNNVPHRCVPRGANYFECR